MRDLGLQVRTLIQRGFDEALQEVDVLVGPAAPTAAFPLGSMMKDPLAMYKNDMLTVGLNLAGEELLCLVTERLLRHGGDDGIHECL